MNETSSEQPTTFAELYSEHPAMFKNNPIGFILALLLIPVFGIGLIILLVWYFKCKGTKFTIYENEIHFEEGLLSKSRIDISLSSVRTTRVNQGFFERIFGVGTVEIYTAGDKPEIVVKGLPDPDKIRDIIK